MCISSSYQTAPAVMIATNHTIQPRWQLSAYHIAPPSRSVSSFSQVVLRSPHPNAARIHPNSSLFHIETTGCPSPGPCSRTTPVAQPVPLEEGLPPSWDLRYDPRGRPYYSMSTTIHAVPSGLAYTPICRRLSPLLTLPPRPRCRGDAISENIQRRRYLRRRALALRMGGPPHARPLSLFVCHRARRITWNYPRRRR